LWNHRQVFDQSIRKLKERKDYLFSQPTTEKWEISKDCPHQISELAKNKKLAFEFLLPKETLSTLKIKEMYGYLCNQLKDEMYRLWDKNYEQMKQFLINFAKNESAQTGSVS